MQSNANTVENYSNKNAYAATNATLARKRFLNAKYPSAK